jgi:hypothetical protein
MSRTKRIPFHCQDRALDSEDVAAFLEHLLREVSDRPELNPGEGLWQQLKGVELCNLCCFNIPHLKHVLRDAVKRVRRKAHLIQSFFRGAKL